MKDTSRIASDKELRATAEGIAGPELVQSAGTIGLLGKATEVLGVARNYRNSWIGHGGHIKVSDATRLVEELQQSIRGFYENTASIFHHLQLVRPGKAEVADTGLKFRIERLVGSDPVFQRKQVELDRLVKSNALAFWMSGARTMCHAVPFFASVFPNGRKKLAFTSSTVSKKGGFAGFPIKRPSNNRSSHQTMNSLASLRLDKGQHEAQHQL